MIQLDWEQIKTVASQRSLTLHWVLFDDRYRIWAVDNQLLFETQLLLVQTTEVAEFEASYKTPGNKSPVQNTVVQLVPAYGNKKVNVNGVIKNLFARNRGIQQTLTTGTNTVSYTCTYPWAKLVGAEIIGGETLDTVNFKVYDTATGTYSGVANALLNQFGFNVNISSGFYKREAPYDADIYQNMVLALEYTSVSNKTIGVNLLMNEVKT